MDNQQNNNLSKEVNKNQESTTQSSHQSEPEIEEVKPKEPFYNNISSVNKDNLEEAVNPILPTAKHSEMTEFVNQLDDLDEETFDPQEQQSVIFNVGGVRKTYPEDMLVDKINSDEFNPNNEDNFKYVNVKAKGNLKGSNAVAKFTSKLNTGKYTAVTLWHSGITLLLKPPKDSDFLHLQHQIAKIEHELGIETNNLVYSNYGVIANRIVSEFILSHVVASSVDIDEDKLLDHIKLTDLNILAVGLIASRKPNGYEITINCKNSLKIVDGLPLCNFTATAKINPERLIWKDLTKLTTEQLAHISKTSKHSQTLKEVIDYQDNLEVNQVKEVVIETEGGSLIFGIKTPSLRKHIEIGETWVNYIIKQLEELVSNNDNEEERRKAVDGLIKSSILNKYNSFIEYIKDDDGAYTDDIATIIDILEEFSSEDKIVNQLLDEIVDYINRSYIALVATYNFICPTCKAAGREGDQGGSNIEGFKEFIPLNAVEHFFDLSTLTAYAISNRKM